MGKQNKINVRKEKENYTNYYGLSSMTVSSVYNKKLRYRRDSARRRSLRRSSLFEVIQGH